MSLSSAFTQTRLFWPDGVKILFLMLTYLSTLRSKTGFFLVRPEKCVFCKFTQHQPSPSLRSGEFKEGDATTISSWRASWRKAKDRGAEKAEKGEKAGRLSWRGGRACQPHLRKAGNFDSQGICLCWAEQKWVARTGSCKPSFVVLKVEHFSMPRLTARSITFNHESD